MFNFYEVTETLAQEINLSEKDKTSFVILTTELGLKKELSLLKNMYINMFETDVFFRTNKINEKQYIEYIKNNGQTNSDLFYFIKETYKDGTSSIINFRLGIYNDIIEKFQKLKNKNTDAKYTLHIAGFVFYNKENKIISEEELIPILANYNLIYFFEDEIEKQFNENKKEGRIYFDYINKHYEELEYELKFKIVDF